MRLKILNRNALKYTAIFAMLLDHTAYFFRDFPVLYFIMHFIGRLTAPIMCFFIAEGFYYTRSKLQYGLRLGVFALISQFAYIFYNTGTIFTPYFFIYWNVIFTFFVGFLVLLAYEKIRNKPVKFAVIALLCAASFIGDWMLIAPLWILFFYIFRTDNFKKFTAYGIIAAITAAVGIVWWSEITQVGVFMAIPVLLLYNGQKGGASPVHKWIFYIFYPLHLILIALVEIYTLYPM
ncbi:MAG: conjugal transfer protein TraX [Oscillospiraceae bacterium]|nr:conjugal transfer protein TraX [Oscillospiraceae bacterium]